MTKQKVTVITDPSRTKEGLVPQYDHQFNIAIIGDGGVGKSSLLLRFTDDTYSERWISTIGADFKTRTIEEQGWKVKLKVWDTVGQERFRPVYDKHGSQFDAILLAYDCTDYVSFNNTKEWLRRVKQCAKSGIPIILVATKTDLPVLVDIETVEGFAEQWNEENKDDGFQINAVVETSAKNDVNVNNVFWQATRQILNNKFANERIMHTTAKRENVDPIRENLINRLNMYINRIEQYRDDSNRLVQRFTEFVL